MNKLFRATAFALALGLAVPAMAASETDCKAKWTKADVGKNGVLQGKKAAAYLDAIARSGKTYEMKTANELSSTEFMAACKGDAFKNMTASR